MKLFEYQGKELFREVGISVPISRLVRVQDPDANKMERLEIYKNLLEAEKDFAQLSTEGSSKGGVAKNMHWVPPLVLKAQTDMGGRGKAGLIKFIEGTTKVLSEHDRSVTHINPSNVPLLAAADAILDGGINFPALLIEKASEVDQELYLSISVEAASACHLILASSEGGVDIEDLAKERPEAIKRVLVDPFRGLQAFQARTLGFELDLAGSRLPVFSELLVSLYELFVRKDAELIEINPLFVTKAGELQAGDAKVIIDDNSLFRHGEFQLSRDQFDSDIAYEAAMEGIPYLQFDGNISLMCAGAGLTTAVFDIVKDFGGNVANYLEFGGPNYHRAQRAMELCLKNSASVILIVTFGTIARADVMAQGVVDAISVLKPKCPIITCIRGTNENESDRILRSAGLKPLYDMEDAVQQAVEIAKKVS